MGDHPVYDACSTQVLRAYEGLEDGADDERAGDLTSHECAWNERINYAALTAYYCGYCAAMTMIERVRPYAAEGMMDQILAMEYQLGVTLPKARRDARRNAPR